MHEMYSFLVKEIDKGFNKETLKNITKNFD